MKNKIILTAIVFISSLNIIAQQSLSPEITYNVSNPYKEFNANENFRYYFNKGNEVMSFKISDNDVVLIQKFNSDKPEFIKATKYEKLFPKGIDFDGVYEIGTKYYLFYAVWDLNRNKKEQLFAQEIDFEKGEIKGDAKSIINSDAKIMGEYYYMYNAVNKFKFINSFDKSLLQVKYKKMVENIMSTDNFETIVFNNFDEELNLKSTQEITFPYTQKQMDDLDYKFDNKGNLYIISKIYNDGSGKKKTKDSNTANYHFELFTIPSGTSKINITKFDNKGKFIDKLILTETKNNYFICAGYYMNNLETFSEDEFNGVFSFKFKEDGQIYDQLFQNFSLDIINQNESESKISKNKKKKIAFVENLMIKELVPTNDEGFLIIGEQDVEEIGDKYSHHYYKDIYVSKINYDNKCLWTKKIPKAQVTGGGNLGLSFKAFTFNNKSHFFILDHIKNVNLTNQEPEEFKKFGDGYILDVEVSHIDGTLTRKPMFKISDFNKHGIHIFSPERIIKINENSLLMEAYKKDKEDFLIKINLN